MPAAWDRQEGESEASYGHFCAYRDDLERPRLKSRTAEQQGVSRTHIYQISNQWDWEERVRAFDAWTAAPTLTVRQASLVEFEEALNVNLQQKLVAVESIAAEELRKLREKQVNGEDVDLLHLKRLVSLIGEADTLARRSASLPTVFIREKTDKETDDGNVYIIGS